MRRLHPPSPWALEQRILKSFRRDDATRRIANSIALEFFEGLRKSCTTRYDRELTVAEFLEVLLLINLRLDDLRLYIYHEDHDERNTGSDYHSLRDLRPGIGTRIPTEFDEEEESSESE